MTIRTPLHLVAYTLATVEIDIVASVYTGPCVAAALFFLQPKHYTACTYRHIRIGAYTYF